jgi:hypothetical protein
MGVHVPNWPVLAVWPLFRACLGNKAHAGKSFTFQSLRLIALERVKGIEPSYSAWEAEGDYSKSMSWAKVRGFVRYLWERGAKSSL